MIAKKAKEKAQKVWVSLKEKGLKKDDLLLLKLTDVGFPDDFINSVKSYERWQDYEEITSVSDLLAINVKDLLRNANFFGPRHANLLKDFKIFFEL
jgi:hypothetical protein